MDSRMFLSRRDGPFIFVGAPSAPPYTTSALTANLVCRVLFGILSNMACLVPLRLLYRNGEFAAVVFILNLEVLNVRNIVNALIWRNNDMASWWPGYGLCDVDAYIVNIFMGLYSSCLLAIVRNLALQVGSLRAHPLTQKEKRRRNLVQALIIFPLPIIQAALTFPLAAHRYWIGALVGCSWDLYPSWPFLVFFALGPAVLALIASAYAVAIYLRFREVVKTTQSVLSSNRVASARSQRAKRRLYLMVVCILVPYLPVVVAMTVSNIVLMGPLQPFDYHAIHNPDNATTSWNTVMLLPSTELKSIYLNNCYISIVSAIPIFLFFGMTKDAMNCYRVLLLRLGLGRVFPCLHEEYNPDRRGFGSSAYGSSSYTTPAESFRKKANNSSNQFNSVASSSTGSSSRQLGAQPARFHTSTSSGNALDSLELQRPAPSRHAPHSHDAPIRLPHRNPFLFRTRLNLSIPFSLSSFKTPGAEAHHASSPTPSLPLQPLRPLHLQPHRGRFQTAASTWSDEESRLFKPSSQPSILRPPSSTARLAPLPTASTS